MKSPQNIARFSSDVKLSRRNSPDFDAVISEMVRAYTGRGFELTKLIIELCDTNYDAASALFFGGRTSGEINADNSSPELFMSLCKACVKVGSPHFIFKYLGHMDDARVPRDVHFLSSLVKVLTFKKHFKICLSVNDSYFSLLSPTILSDETTSESAKVALSCLLYCSVEAKEYWRALKLFRQLEKTGKTPSDKDLLNVMKAAIFREDWKSIVAVVNKSNEGGDLKALELGIVTLLKVEKYDLVESIIRSMQSKHLLKNIFHLIARSKSRHSFLECVLGKEMLDGSTLRVAGDCIGTWEIENPLNIVRSILNDSRLVVIPEVQPIVSGLISKSKVMSCIVFNSLVGDLRLALYTYGLRPIPAIYSALFEKASSFSDIMDVCNLFDEQSQVDDRFPPDDRVRVSGLERIHLLCAKDPRTAWSCATRLMSSEPSEQCLTFLIRILLTNSQNSETYIEIAHKLLSGSKRCDQALAVQTLESAIRLKNPRLVSTLFPLITRDGKRVRPEVVERLLTLCGPELGIYHQVLELALIHRLPIKENAIRRDVAAVVALLKKYKYRL